MAHAIVLELPAKQQCVGMCVCVPSAAVGATKFASALDDYVAVLLLHHFALSLCSVLSDNSIARIDVDAFLGLTKLKRLSLHNCGLTAVPAEALRRIRGLHTLYVLMAAEARLALAQCAFLRFSLFANYMLFACVRVICVRFVCDCLFFGCERTLPFTGLGPLGINL